VNGKSRNNKGLHCRLDAPTQDSSDRQRYRIILSRVVHLLPLVNGEAWNQLHTPVECTRDGGQKRGDRSVAAVYSTVKLEAGRERFALNRKA